MVWSNNLPSTPVFTQMQHNELKVFLFFVFLLKLYCGCIEKIGKTEVNDSIFMVFCLVFAEYVQWTRHCVEYIAFSNSFNYHDNFKS